PAVRRSPPGRPARPVPHPSRANPMHIRTRLLLPAVLTAAPAACQPSQPQAAAAAAPAADPAAAEAVPEAVEGVSGTYVIDPAHTTVIAQWNHFGFSNPVANFGD